MEAQGSLLLFAPVLIGIGVGTWFALPVEPGLAIYAAVLGVGVLAAVFRIWSPEPLHAPVVAVLCLCLGVLSAGLRAHLVAAPVLQGDYSGPVQGRIIEIDRSASDALRITLDRVWLAELGPDATPQKVRISLSGQEPSLTPGMTILVSARLSRPQGPVEPGAFDFRRMAWFDGLGAVGYTRTPPVLWAAPEGFDEWVGRIRTSLSLGIRTAIPGEAGAFAAGSMTGDRSGIGADTVAALRDSNLAHLLAISGMNLAFLTGFVFFLLRGGIALIPPLALRVNGKKIAAVVALIVAAFYLALSGANVATQRAFIMAAVMLGAILLDRKAISLRSVAISAIILLLWQPESLLAPGFQLSYAATIGLIAGFRWLDGRAVQERLPRWVLPVYTLFLSSAVAGAVTAPFAAGIFNRFTDYGLLANMLTVPAMTVLMAAGVVAGLLAPFGLAYPALWVTGKAAEWILWVAHQVSAIEGAVTPIPSPHPAILPVFALGMLWIVAWPGRARWAGVVPVVLAFCLWPLSSRPVLLIDQSGAIAGVLGPEGRALSKGKGGGFAAENWLQNDGDLADQKTAAVRPGFRREGNLAWFDLAGRKGVLATGKDAAPMVGPLCGKAGLVITDQKVTSTVTGGCLVLDSAVLARTGAIAIWDGPQGLDLVQSRQAHRIWDSPSEAPLTLTLPPKQ
jgi:competence protein ComEC